MDTNYLSRQEYALGHIQEHIELFIYAAVAFFVPFFIGHPQAAVGIIVNAALVMAALNLRNMNVWPIIMLPSLGVLSRGIIFGPYTPYLLYMIPFIWAGNAVLVLAIKKMYLDVKMNRGAAIGISALIKTALLSAAAYALVSMGTIPALFLTTMSVFQLWTALAGGGAALGLQWIKRRTVRSAV